MEYLEGNEIFKEELIDELNKYSIGFKRKNNEDEQSLASKYSPEIASNKNADASFVNSETEEELAKAFWKKIKKGDMDALGQLYDLYIDELFSYGMEKVHNKTRVMDAIHDLFVDLYKYRSSITIPTNVKYYLLRSLKRKVYRKQASKKCIDLQDAFLETKQPNAELNCEEKIIEGEYSKEKKDKLKSALTFLTKRQQKALHLRYTENRPYTEIADTMNISIATSRTVVYRALLVLKKHCVSLVLIISSIFF